MLKWIRENARAALTGKTDGTEKLVFERDGLRFVGSAALADYETKLADLKRRFQGDQSGDFERAAQTLYQQYKKGG